jgi:hypothetical protein
MNFRAILFGADPARLDAWVTEANASGPHHIRSFAPSPDRLAATCGRRAIMVAIGPGRPHGRSAYARASRGRRHWLTSRRAWRRQVKAPRRRAMEARVADAYFESGPFAQIRAQADTITCRAD